LIRTQVAKRQPTTFPVLKSFTAPFMTICAEQSAVARSSFTIIAAPPITWSEITPFANEPSVAVIKSVAVPLNQETATVALGFQKDVIRSNWPVSLAQRSLK